MPNNPEKNRLDEEKNTADWRRWGPYLSDRQWGTVREDYSADGSAWEYFSHDASRSRAYRWGEDGIGGFSDDEQQLCFSLAMWNEKDGILKERFFGLTGNQGNHGEDVKELYYFLDATPTHSYLKMLYKYPQREFPYTRLVEENHYRDRSQAEFELIDTGIFEANKYFDVFIEFAKAGPFDILVKITAHNRGPTDAPLHLLPMIFFRNTWSWAPNVAKPSMKAAGAGAINTHHEKLGDYTFYVDDPAAEMFFTENESNGPLLYKSAGTGFYKDAFHELLVHGNQSAVNPNQTGTKAAAHVRRVVPAGGKTEIRARLTRGGIADAFLQFDEIFNRRLQEADTFYAQLQSKNTCEDERLVQRQAWAGMIWCKQFFNYDVRQWLQGDPLCPPPPPQRKSGRNSEWANLTNSDILSMPDSWEYPWYAAWDLAFHCIPLAMIDPEFAKRQLILLTREWYMHPNGQLPAYEWAFGDVNPPVHAWAALRVYQIDREANGGTADTAFLQRVFNKLLLNFTWWVNRKDSTGRNIFQGGFLGLDNIGVFDRSAQLPTGGYLSQCDGTSWMAMYSLNLMRIAIELSETTPIYQDLATKFFEHFLFIASAMTNLGDMGIDMWDDTDEFYYDVLSLPDGSAVPLKLRSMVGLIPLFAVEVLDFETMQKLPDFKQRLEWFLNYRPDLAGLVSRWTEMGKGETRLLSLLRGHRMKCLLRRMLDETEFLSPYGIRALSKVYQANPYVFQSDGKPFTVKYAPGESDTNLFGGNSNWRGPIWMPVNFLLVESLRKFHAYYGDDFKIECPVGSGKMLTIREVADEIAKRLTRLFLRDDNGNRAVFNQYPVFQTDPHFKDYILFHEYFHGDTGRGVGASHQTGWTGLVAALIKCDNHAVNSPAMQPSGDKK